MTDFGRVQPHKTSHQNGGSDEISLAGLAGPVLFVPYNANIATINESDTDKHTLDLETALTETRTILSLFVNAARSSGTGFLNGHPNEGSRMAYIGASTQVGEFIIADKTQRLQYRQTVANDTFELYCLGYTVVTV